MEQMEINGKLVQDGVKIVYTIEKNQKKTNNKNVLTQNVED